MEIVKKLDNNCLVLTISGRLDTTTAPQLEDALKEYNLEEMKVVFDIQNLAYISSAGLRVLLTTHKATKGNFVLKNVCEDVMDVFDITGFKDILNIE